MPEIIDPRLLLVNVARLLDKLKIRYVITGGMAVFVWGRPRFTADIDIVVQMQDRDVDVLAEHLTTLSEASYISKEAMRHALERFGEFNFIDGASGIKVDFFVSRKELFEEQKLARRVRRKILTHNVSFISPEDLILSKLRWHQQGESTKQLEDVESVLRIQKKLDWKYLRKWSKIQKTEDILNELWKKNK